MPHPSQHVQAIERALANLKDTVVFNPQQEIFINHIRKIASELKQAVDPIPQTLEALYRIVPTFGDSFLQQQIALFGYARLLLESPESFGDVELKGYHREQVEQIYKEGQALYKLTERICHEALAEHRRQHTARPEPVNLQRLLQSQHEILNYFLRNTSVELVVDVDDVIVQAARYHLAALLQHIIVTLSEELIRNGNITITSRQTNTEAAIIVSCLAMQLTQETIDIIFKKNGRYIYARRFAKDDGSLRFSHNRHGSSIELWLPLADFA